MRADADPEHLFASLAGTKDGIFPVESYVTVVSLVSSGRNFSRLSRPYRIEMLLKKRFCLAS
jgi:hypothetical protein